MNTKADYIAGLQTFTEKVLTYRRKRILRERMKQQSRNVVLDWIYALVWAACFVLVANQYVFQAYAIPSGSMEKTLLIKDRVFVDKFSFGPELLPSVAKMPGLASPARGDIITFENPAYISRGSLFSIAQQMLYMLSFTLIDIDRDVNGEQRAHYLIKRAVGVGGDTVRLVRGEVFIRPSGSDGFIPEAELFKGQGLPVKTQRSVNPADYSAVEAAGRLVAYTNVGLKTMASSVGASQSDAYRDSYTAETVRLSTLRDIYPHDARIAEAAQRYALGYYIAPTRILPLGDNRDNSNDGRYFGPVATGRVLGHARYIYWPLGRAGALR